MISAALTAFLTGITEPIEFAFLFVAPILMAFTRCWPVSPICSASCGIKHGFTFSHGLIDYVVLFPKSTNALWLFVLGPIWAGLYFVVFSFFIRKFNLKTPGREDRRSRGGGAQAGDAFSLQIVRALGGRSNIVDLDSCITRLRVKLKDASKVNADGLKRSAPPGCDGWRRRAGHLRHPLGCAENRDRRIPEDRGSRRMRLSRHPGQSASRRPASSRSCAIHSPPTRLALLIKALGGKANIQRVDACAETRLRIVTTNGALDEAALRAAGVEAIVKLPDHVIHLLTGLNADQYAAEMRGQLAKELKGR